MSTKSRRRPKTIDPWNKSRLRSRTRLWDSSGALASRSFLAERRALTRLAVFGGVGRSECGSSFSVVESRAGSNSDENWAVKSSLRALRAETSASYFSIFIRSNFRLFRLSFASSSVGRSANSETRATSYNCSLKADSFFSPSTIPSSSSVARCLWPLADKAEWNDSSSLSLFSIIESSSLPPSSSMARFSALKYTDWLWFLSPFTDPDFSETEETSDTTEGCLLLSRLSGWRDWWSASITLSASAIQLSSNQIPELSWPFIDPSSPSLASKNSDSSTWSRESLSEKSLWLSNDSVGFRKFIGSTLLDIFGGRVEKSEWDFIFNIQDLIR